MAAGSAGRSGELGQEMPVLFCQFDVLQSIYEEFRMLVRLEFTGGGRLESSEWRELNGQFGVKGRVVVVSSSGVAGRQALGGASLQPCAGRWAGSRVCDNMLYLF